jgi:hypothetical protein
MSTHGDFIGYLVFRESSNPEKGDFAPLVRGDQEKSDLWSYLEKPHQDKRGFW